MTKRIFTAFCFLIVLATVFLPGCSSPTIVPPAPTPTDARPSPTPKPSFTIGAEAQHARLLVTEYYVLIDHGLYEEAYEMLDPASPQRRPKEEFVEGASVIYENLDLQRVQAYDEFIEEAGLTKFVPPEGTQYVFVELITWPKGSKPEEGWTQGMFVKLTKVGEEWKISSFATSQPERR